MGPFIAFSNATYDETELTCRGADDCPAASSDRIYATSSHQWFWLGVHGPSRISKVALPLARSPTT
jgi:hypothetical protein